MDGPVELDWVQGNAEILAVEFKRLSLALAQEDVSALKADTQVAAIEKRLSAPSELSRITRAFGLNEMERATLLLAVLADQKPALSGALERHAYSVDGRATPAVIDAILGDADALRANGPLRMSGLVDLGDAARHYERPIFVAESVRETLSGRRALDPALAALLTPIPVLGRGSADRPERIARRWAEACASGPACTFFAPAADQARELSDFAVAVLALGQAPRLLADTSIPTDPQQMPEFVRTLRRDLILTETALAISCAANPGGAWALADALDLPVFVVGSTPPSGLLSPSLRMPEAPDNLSPWAALFGDDVAASPEVKAVSDHFSLSVPQIRRAVDATAAGFAPNLTTAARTEVGELMGHLAHRVSPLSAWEDLVLPPAQSAALEQMSSFLSNRQIVLQDWGFSGKSQRGLGMAAIFHGPSGTGKTTAAEALVARMEKVTERELPLYRVNVAGLVSKYIGETAKNFEAVFSAGKAMGAALLFDEAEGLFGRRTGNVRDSIDKHSNAELGFLLQCLEDYPGIAILTTNMRAAIDDAFFRRFRFAIEFPFPDRALRKRIWARVIPDALPRADLDFSALAAPPLSGGNIRSVAINAAYLAAAEGGEVTMRHMARAVRLEFSKLEKPVPEKDIKGWDT